MSRIQILYLGFRSTLFIGSLFLGGTVIWSGQLRDAQNLRWRGAAAVFWPETLSGVALLSVIIAAAPGEFSLAVPIGVTSRAVGGARK
jgi:membrane glycosyltransferase